MGGEGLVEVEELGIPFREGMFAEGKADEDVVDSVGLVGGVYYGSGGDAELERHVGRW